MNRTMDDREKLVGIVCDAMEDGCVGHCNQAPYFPVERVVNALIENGVTVQEWISVKDRLPDDNERVIAYRPNEPETSAYKYCVMWGWSVKTSLKHRGITHWCCLPQPPKGE